MSTRRNWTRGFASVAFAMLGPVALAQQYPPYTPPAQYDIQYQQYPQGGTEPAPPVTPYPQKFTAGQIDQLVAPIALYPDPLLAQLFPAATYPDDVTAAAQWVQANANNITEDAIAAGPWDPAIKAMIHYPTVLQMMAQQIAWTEVLGQVFMNQQQDVMDSIQRLRAEAQQAGSLQNNAQQQVVPDNGAIRIEPVNPDELYVPAYDPNLAYVEPAAIDYGSPIVIGIWLDNDFDWWHRCINVGGGWYRGWHHPPDWDRHPPRWDRHPPNYVAPSPYAWVRAPERPPLKRATVDVVNRAFAHPGSAQHPVVVPGRRSVSGASPGVPEQRNFFGGPQSWQELQRAQDRGQVIHAPPAHGALRSAEPAQSVPGAGGAAESQSRSDRSPQSRSGPR
jgi:hypothetical protein